VRPRSLTVRGTHDLRLHVLEWSDAGPALLLLHGFGHSARVWDPFVPDLAGRFHVFALDARGHGDSEHDPEYRYHHASIAADLGAVLAGLRAERATLVAHSMSGYAALRFAAREPERVERLVLVDAGPELSGRPQRGEREPPETVYPSPEAYADALARQHPHTPRETLLRLARHWLRPDGEGRFVPRLDPAFLRPRASPDAPANRRSFDRARWAREETLRLWRCAERVRCPTLVVRGELSPMLSAATVARMVGEVMADATEVVIPGAGHAVMLDAPEPFRGALAGFLLADPG
jgi:pimeloyl-ACP methyl ester carboxylesterase